MIKELKQEKYKGYIINFFKKRGYMNIIYTYAVATKPGFKTLKSDGYDKSWVFKIIKGMIDDIYLRENLRESPLKRKIRRS